MITLTPMNIVQAAGRPALVARPAQVPRPADSRCREGGIGWIPYFLERIDYMYQHAPARGRGQDFGDKLPSELFREHIITCFIDDPVGVEEPPRDRHRHDHLGVRLPALRLARGPTRPRRC